MSAYTTLYEVLVTLAKVLAPVIPFVTETIYRNLGAALVGGRESVHLEDYPISDPSLIDMDLADRTRLAMRLSSLGRSARSKAGLRVRQPLEHLYVHTRTVAEVAMLPLVEDQILDELNVKNLIHIADASEIVNLRVQPNLPILGPKYGKEVVVI